MNRAMQWLAHRPITVIMALTTAACLFLSAWQPAEAPRAVMMLFKVNGLFTGAMVGHWIWWLFFRYRQDEPSPTEPTLLCIERGKTKAAFIIGGMIAYCVTLAP